MSAEHKNPKTEPSSSPEPKDRLIHRDLSWLDFNGRVLEEAADPSNPLLEQTRFLAIFVNNLDEFVMVRVGALRRLLDSKFNKQDDFGYYPADLLAEIRIKVDGLLTQLKEIYVKKILKELNKHHIVLARIEDLSAEQKKFANRYFDTNLFPIITPMAIDQSHPFPHLPSKTMAFAVHLTRQDKSFLAIVPVPRALGRLLRIPSDKNTDTFILIEDLLRSRLDDLFRGYKITGSALFRVLRNSEIAVDEEYAADLLKAIESEIKKRPKAPVVWLEIEETVPEPLTEILSEAIGFPTAEIRKIRSDFDLTFLFELISAVSKPQLLYPGFIPTRMEYPSIFDHIRESDFLLHLPYQSFQPTIDLIQQAAVDPAVLGIKITLYRTSEDSSIIKALKEAARNKKQVTALVELKARFDEEKNINWAKELEDAGCHVIYGLPGMKIHSKITLIVRKEDNRIRRYVHLSTGNYNESTARVYTDIGYFTANDDFARDISDVFNVVTGYSQPSRWKRVISSPNDLRTYFFELIDQEMEFQKKFKNGLVLAKMNSLEDPQMAEKLYAASAAGVKIQLLVRGICCLIPRVADKSENIRVRSIVGRFLEHSRIFIFNNNNSPRVFLASADWMRRNFDRRIELLFEVHNEDLKNQLRAIMDTYWKDNAKTRELTSERVYKRIKTDTDERFCAQDAFLKQYSS